MTPSSEYECSKQCESARQQLMQTFKEGIKVLNNEGGYELDPAAIQWNLYDLEAMPNHDASWTVGVSLDQCGTVAACPKLFGSPDQRKLGFAAYYAGMTERGPRHIKFTESSGYRIPPPWVDKLELSVRQQLSDLGEIFGRSDPERWAKATDQCSQSVQKLRAIAAERASAEGNLPIGEPTPMDWDIITQINIKSDAVRWVARSRLPPHGTQPGGEGSVVLPLTSQSIDDDNVRTTYGDAYHTRSETARSATFARTTQSQWLTYGTPALEQWIEAHHGDTSGVFSGSSAA